MTTKPFKWIGITGNIASGKTTVAKFLMDMGYPVLDADYITRGIYTTENAQNRNVRGQILKTFGSLDTSVLRTKAFSNLDLKRDLESILHPFIREQSLKWMEAQKKNGAEMVFYEASLLIETGIPEGMTGVLLITTPDPVRMERLKKRNPNIPSGDLENMLNAQMSQEEKKPQATWCIENTGTTQELAAKVSSWLESIKG